MIRKIHVKPQMSLLLLLLSGIALAQTGSDPLQKGAFSARVTALPDYQKQCQELRANLRSICPPTTNYENCRPAKNQISELLSIQEQIPKFDQTHVQAFNQFFAIKNPVQQDIQAFFKLVSQDCWKADELKVWRALSFPTKVPEYHNLVLKKAELARLTIGQNSFSLLRLMIDIKIIRTWLDSGIYLSDQEKMLRLEDLYKRVEKAAKRASTIDSPSMANTHFEETSIQPKEANLNVKDQLEMLRFEKQSLDKLKGEFSTFVSQLRTK